MRRHQLREYQRSEPIQLGTDQRDALHGLVPSLTIEPATGTTDHYHLTSSSDVGIVKVGDLTLELSPKIDMRRVLFLLSYAANPDRWWQTDVELGADPELFEIMAIPFHKQVTRAFRRGLLQGYRTFDESLPTVRGRVDFNEQLRRWNGCFPPVECRFDEYTEDIDANRLIKAAAHRLSTMPLRSDVARRRVRSLEPQLTNVSLVEYESGRLPEPMITRLNAHYEPALALASLILSSISLELREGECVGKAFLFDMNRVFEDFIYVALRESLGASKQSLRQGDPTMRLDAGGKVRLQPDLSLWHGDRCVFVGDVKYKRTTGSIVNGDLYQLLAYTIAAGLPEGLLILAEGDAPTEGFQVTEAGKRLRVVTVDLSAEPTALLAQVDDLVRDFLRGVSGAVW